MKFGEIREERGGEGQDAHVRHAVVYYAKDGDDEKPELERDVCDVLAAVVRQSIVPARSGN